MNKLHLFIVHAAQVGSRFDYEFSKDIIVTSKKIAHLR